MKHPGAFQYIRFVVWGISLAASTACARHWTPDIDAERPDARSVDSVRNARAEQSRSSATQAVDFDDDERSRFTRVEQMIQARFSGVQVIPRGGSFTIRIRGMGSFSSSNEPLVVIDGASRSAGDLNGLNPRDIERIEVIKDAAASIYGMRGANGVIVITTRRGR
jgi:TonB-dependent SusC/RagA subfamily outer membrane receptor